MRLIDIYDFDRTSALVLYDLLKERTKEQSISHKAMPTFEEHVTFIRSKPYSYWYFIINDYDIVGSIYLTEAREVGVFIFKDFHGNGYGPMAIEKLREMHPGRLLANVNPQNEASRNMFRKMGAKLIQVTYELGEE